MATLKKVESGTEYAIDGMAKGAALEHMIREGISYKDAEVYWKAHGARTKSTGFRADFYSALSGGASLNDKVALIEFMKANKASENDIKQYSHYLAIAKLVDDVRS